MGEKKKLPCDVCGHDMYDPKANYTVTAVRVSIQIAYQDPLSKHREIQRVVKTFGKLAFDVCYVCYLKSLGVKPKRKKKG